MKLIELSPSVAFSLVDLAKAAARSPGSNIRTFQRFSGNGFTSKELVELGLSLSWFELVGQHNVCLTSSILKSVHDMTSTQLVRKVIKDYCNIFRPPWLQLTREGRFPALLQSPAAVRQLMVDAGLAYGIDEETIKFWDELASEARDAKETRLLEIGRIGERLSCLYEERRTGHRPNWCAVDDSTLGYDLISRVSSADSTPLTIEVKTSTVSTDFATLHLTRNEWNIANLAKSHKFHLWCISGKKAQLGVIEVSDMEKQVPVDRNFGNWSMVIIPFSSFSENWQTIDF